MTLDELAQHAAAVEVPAGEAAKPRRRAYLEWVGDDPVRAFAVWQKLARDSGHSLHITSNWFYAASMCRLVVLDHAQLDAADVERLAKQ